MSISELKSDSVNDLCQEELHRIGSLRAGSDLPEEEEKANLKKSPWNS